MLVVLTVMVAARALVADRSTKTTATAKSNAVGRKRSALSLILHIDVLLQDLYLRLGDFDSTLGDTCTFFFEAFVVPANRGGPVRLFAIRHLLRPRGGPC